MKLNTISVVWNNFTFENEGVAPQSYGGKVVFKDEQGNYTQITLSAAAIDQIMQTVALEVANNAKRMLAEMTLENVRDAARPQSLTCESHIEEGEFNESF